MHGLQYFGMGAASQSVVGDRFSDPALQGKAVRFVGEPGLRHAWAYAPDFGRAIALLVPTANAQLLNRHCILPHATHLPARDLAQLLFGELLRQNVLSEGDTPRSAVAPGALLKLLW